MKKDFSRYFSGNPLTRLPLHKVVLSLCCALALTVSLGAGIVATALNADSSSVVSSSLAGSDTSSMLAAESTPAPTPEPDKQIRMETTIVQQDLGIDLFYVNPPEPAEASNSDAAQKAESGASKPASAPAATPEPQNTEPVPVTDVALKILVTDEKGKSTSYDVDQKSGTLLIEDMEPGKYKVEVEPLEGYVVPAAETVTIKEKVVYKADVDKIKEQIKSDAEVSNEDTKPATDSSSKPAPVIQDTVRYVDSKVDSEVVKADVYLLEGNVKDGYLLNRDGSVSPYKPVTEEKNGNTYIVSAQLDAAAVKTVAMRAVPGMAGHTVLLNSGSTSTQEGASSDATDQSVPSEPSSVPSEPETPTPTPEATPTPTPTPEPTPTPTPTPEPTPTPTPTPVPTPTPNLPQNVVLYSNGELKPCDMFQLTTTNVVMEEKKIISGWYTDDATGKMYYYNPDNNQPVTGQQVINGQMYTFTSDGVKTNELRGIDVSKYQRNIDWNQVKASGIDFVIIRAGYRGWGTGALVEDPMLASHVAGARAAGLKIGLYFFTQAVDEQEAVDEASFVVSLIRKYGIPVSYPIYYDTENSDGHGAGRADSLSRSQRTANTVAFCETIRNAGYTPGVYSYRSWLTGNLNFAQVSRYKIWVAHFASKLDFPYKYDMWQYTSNGSVPGIPGRVDMNLI